MGEAGVNGSAHVTKSWHSTIKRQLLHEEGLEELHFLFAQVLLQYFLPYKSSTSYRRAPRTPRPCSLPSIPYLHAY